VAEQEIQQELLQQQQAELRLHLTQLLQQAEVVVHLITETSQVVQAALVVVQLAQALLEQQVLEL
jgi:hypothetical protein